MNNGGYLSINLAFALLVSACAGEPSKDITNSVDRTGSIEERLARLERVQDDLIRRQSEMERHVNQIRREIDSMQAVTSRFRTGGESVYFDPNPDSIDVLNSGRTDVHPNTPGLIGITMMDNDWGINPPFGYERNSGIKVVDVYPGGGAEKSGLKVGDIIVRFDGISISNGESLIAARQNKLKGEKVFVVYYRDGRFRTIDMTLGGETFSD